MTNRMKTLVKKPARRVDRNQLAHLRAENARLRAELRSLQRGEGSAAVPQVAEPALPPPDAEGYYPAEQTLDVIVAQQIIRRRRAARWTQAELAERAGLRQETISRIESGKHAPNVTTVDKIDRALKAAGV
jgi:DNA-binding XRE family transcriptional regulator